jgi:hypothetical protein
LSRFRGTFHSFDPVGFAIFAILAAGRLPICAQGLLEEYATRMIAAEAVHIRELELMLMKRAPD